jgi:hypothetical protein
MKNRILLLLVLNLCLSTTNLKSQIVLNSNEIIRVGSSWVQKPILSFNVIDTTIQGENVTWNFSTMQATTAAATTITIVNPAQTPYASTFPTSNFCFMESPVTAYRYYTLSSASLERIGSYSGSSLKTFSDPQTELIFPLVYGSQNNDTWMNSGSSFGGTYDFKCIGTGTLILPSGSYSALLLRVLVHEAFIDLTVYYWYHANNGAFLLYYIVGDGLFVPTQGAFIQSLSLGTDEIIALNNFSYNNPVRNLLTLNYFNNTESDIKYVMINNLGEVVYSQNSMISPNENIKFDIDTENLKSGIYFLSIKSNKTGKILKTMKIIKL